MNNKVAMMTWYTYHNYGTALQASALYNVIKELGYSVDVINYLPKAGRKKQTVNLLKTEILEKVKQLMNRNYNSAKRTELFLQYLNNKITQTVPCNSYVELSDLESNYDAFVCGSDQIWSPLNFDEKYFLPFISNDNKKIAYAPSLGTSKIDDLTIRNRMCEHIGKFRHLSVRETRGAEMIQELTGKVAEVVLDPTLLMPAKEWDTYINEEGLPKLPQEKYIVCYFLGDYKKYMGYVRKLSKKMKIPYYVIPVKNKEKKSKQAVPFDIGPREFVSLIRNAEYVCTDSFHGMVFAVNYQIPFNVFKRFDDNDRKNQNSRILSFLKLMNLDERLVDPKSNPKTINLFSDFSKSKIKLDEMRKTSYAFLRNSLEQATQSKQCEEDAKYSITDMCCGCGACTVVCPKGAITVLLDTEGFQHYSIDEEKCIRCGACKTVCPMNAVESFDLKTSLGLYSVKSNRLDVLKKSSSGGVGHELANAFHQSGAFVSGCKYDCTTNNARHILVTPEQTNGIALLQGSKYLQSITHDVMQSILSVTKQNKLIFFGTPCQCAAVDKLCRKYKTRDNVYIVDLICHGVPSIHLWKKYLHDLDMKYSIGTNPKVHFRSNEGKWNLRTLSVAGNNIIHTEKEHKDDFYAFFRRGLCDMKSCYECPYREKSSADLRIGDYWGRRFKDDKEGSSMVLVVNNKGKELISILQRDNVCITNEHSIEEYWLIQAPYNHNPSLMREKIIKELRDNDKLLGELRKEYCIYYDIREKMSKTYQNVLGIIKRE